jgi:hypothetical protein
MCMLCMHHTGMFALFQYMPPFLFEPYPAQVKTPGFCLLFTKIETIILPRQARDKHRENSKK